MKIYTMEFPVRLTHWLNVLSILVLSITGFYIGNPFIHSINENYIMGWMRFIHFVAAYIFTMAISLRLYWLFVGINMQIGRFLYLLHLNNGRKYIKN